MWGLYRRLGGDDCFEPLGSPLDYNADSWNCLFYLFCRVQADKDPAGEWYDDMAMSALSVAERYCEQAKEKELELETLRRRDDEALEQFGQPALSPSENVIELVARLKHRPLRTDPHAL